MNRSIKNKLSEAKKAIILSLFAIIVSTNSFAQTPAFEMNRRLGIGMNLGNTFEAPSLGEWNTDIHYSYFVEIKAKGFSSVRIPARWSAYAGEKAPYTIQPYFMDTVKWAVDAALANGLTVVLDMHHYDEMMKDPAGHKARFLALWKQIADEFRDYPDSLYFEIFNEPNDKFTPTLWNDYLKECLAVIREKNPDRMVVIGTAEWGGIGSLSKLVLPNDPNIIVTIHFYDPFGFTHQGAEWMEPILPIGVKWNGTPAEKNAIRSSMNVVRAYSTTHNVPVYIGEFGAIDNADDESRARWIGFLREVFDEYGFSAAYWEYSSGFGIYNPVLNCYRAGMLQALTGFEGACDCSQLESAIVQNSTFDRDIRPWFLNVTKTDGAAAEITVVDGEARMEILNQGTAPWHIQFLYPSFPLIQGNTYTLTFDAYASAPTSITAMINRDGGDYGMAHETGSFIDALLTTEKQTFTFTFTYELPTMPKARIAFDCGFAQAQYIYFDNIYLLEEAPETPETPETSITNVENSPKCTVKIGGNNFSVAGNSIEMLGIYDVYGRVHYQKTDLHGNFVTIENSLLPSGVGFVHIRTDLGIFTVKTMSH